MASSPRPAAQALRQLEPDPPLRVRSARGSAAIAAALEAERQPKRERRPAKPPLRLVAPRHRRRRAGVAAFLFLITLFAIMVGLAAFQTKLAADQLRIDKLDRQLRAEQVRYEQLRGEVARLESPTAIVSAAKQLGMVPPQPGQITYITPTAQAVAAVTASMGVGSGSNDRTADVPTPVKEWTSVKPLVGAAP